MRNEPARGHEPGQGARPLCLEVRAPVVFIVVWPQSRAGRAPPSGNVTSAWRVACLSFLAPSRGRVWPLLSASSWANGLSFAPAPTAVSLSLGPRAWWACRGRERSPRWFASLKRPRAEQTSNVCKGHFKSKVLGYLGEKRSQVRWSSTLSDRAGRTGVRPSVRCSQRGRFPPWPRGSLSGRFSLAAFPGTGRTAVRS